jgi:hypothetical protein
LKSIRYLILSSAVIRGFKFLNQEGQGEPPVRVIIQEMLNGILPNVVIEVHFLGVNEYEITVKTAICTNEFRLTLGQYALEISDEAVILKKFEGNKLKEIWNF